MLLTAVRAEREGDVTSHTLALSLSGRKVSRGNRAERTVRPHVLEPEIRAPSAPHRL